jgi:hypothetical protein
MVLCRAANLTNHWHQKERIMHKLEVGDHAGNPSDPNISFEVF